MGKYNIYTTDFYYQAVKNFYYSVFSPDIDKVAEKNRVLSFNRQAILPDKKQGATYKGYAPILRIVSSVKDYSSRRISRIWQAALATEVPGPKMAATPAL